jgi:hypothetical protein
MVHPLALEGGLVEDSPIENDTDCMKYADPLDADQIECSFSTAKR